MASNSRTFMPHSIRLNRVWELRILDRSPVDARELDAAVAENPLDARIDLPCIPRDDSQPNAGGVWLLTRRFNRPSNLEPQQPVWLSITPAELGEAAYLNGQPLETSPAEDGPTGNKVSAVRARIEQRLQNNNRLAMLLSQGTPLNSANVRLIIAANESH